MAYKKAVKKEPVVKKVKKKPVKKVDLLAYIKQQVDIINAGGDAFTEYPKEE